MITSWSVNRRNAAGSDSRTEVSSTKTRPAGAGSASACRSRDDLRPVPVRLLETVAAGSCEAPASVRRDVTGLLQRACNPVRPRSATSGARAWHGAGMRGPVALLSQVRADRLARDDPVP
ncbi:hypothetical protein Aau02nite_84650 [Amorphoplanes auranticolor]|uniref:Uncharacterized protein n=1 Tax=Actinoplanes auranticolor TaxID=47988 RepID=A0A919W4C9_9ACTN|nr:hypothetical protein Aau02nite_84650 [Actinoplanes auranticolor]